MTRHLPIIVALFASGASSASAGHSRHSYVDGGQSKDGRYVVTPRRVDGEKPKKGPTPFHWEYEWRDTRTGRTLTGRLDGLRSGTSNVFDPVGSHLFVAPDGETFALWTPQVTMRAPTKKPEGERSGESFRTYAGFERRLVVYRNTGTVVRRFDLDDFLADDDWQWMHLHQCQTYWLLDYPGLHTRSAPRPFYSLFRISPDSTILEFKIGANQEASFKARQRGVEPPEPRTIRVRLTDGKMLEPPDWPTNVESVPVQPFVGRLSDKVHRQQDYVPSLDPLTTPGRFDTPEEP